MCVRGSQCHDGIHFACWTPSLFSFGVGDASTGEKEVILVGHRKGVEGVVGHTGHVLALAVSSDGKFVVSSKMLVVF